MAPYARLAIYKACYVITLGHERVLQQPRHGGGDRPGRRGRRGCAQLLDLGYDDRVHEHHRGRVPVRRRGGCLRLRVGGQLGPTAATVAHPSPWITTTGAGTHNRTGNGSVTIGGTTYNGASLSPVAITGTLVNADDAAAAGQDLTEARQCFAAVDNAGVPVLDPAKVAGKIVVCDRGVNALVNKSLAVKAAGGIGMVLTNVAGGGTNILALLHSVPSVHVAYDATTYAALHAAGDAGAQATIAKATLVFNVPAPTVASFSSRGPLAAGGGDILKPDIYAPGENILAAVAPPGNQNRLFDLYSGTSMSSPHMVGLGALVKQAHPDWSPMAVKSAFMTTAYNGVDTYAGSSTLSPDAQRIWAQGAGHVDPNKAVDPGLVFDSDFDDWINFLRGQGLVTSPGTSLDASDLNQASIAIGDLAGSQTVPRTATNVGPNGETYTFSSQGLTGISVVPSVTSFTAGSAPIDWTVTFTRTSASLNVYQGGFITWTGNRGHVVRMPVVIRPVALSAPAEVTFNTATGPSSWTVKTGYVGTLNATIRGLVPATATPYTVPEDPNANWTGCGDTQGTFVRSTAIPAGATHVRIGVYEDAITPSGTDLDLVRL